MGKPFKGRLENWYMSARYPDQKDNLGFVILGEFNGHPLFHSHFGHTSAVVKVNDDKLPWTVETLNSVYELGTPRNHYQHYYGFDKPID